MVLLYAWMSLRWLNTVPNENDKLCSLSFCWSILRVNLRQVCAYSRIISLYVCITSSLNNDLRPTTPFFLELKSIDRTPAASYLWLEVQYLLILRVDMPLNLIEISCKAFFTSLPLEALRYLLHSATIAAFFRGVNSLPMAYLVSFVFCAQAKRERLISLEVQHRWAIWWYPLKVLGECNAF